MDVYEDPATWTPLPTRPRGLLIVRFAATVVFLPVLIVLWIVAALGFIAVGLLTEVIAAVSSSYEKGLLKLMERTLDRLSGVPAWGVTWSELRHEGDAAYYGARVDKVVADWTRKASAPRRPKKSRPPVECAIPVRDYRGVGGRHVAEVALAQGWELRPTDVRKEVRLWWSAASRVD
ncbi:hypothetical protein FE633_36260 [Streptomyces montanus]|uniref:Uncharacterized protein n=1 Tax=Streptomyces montanus TaxID=2580423 RepID=A0A5R9FH08_9ACTN|nr:hypothetical protein [Streptomyces montanus]TLS41410.1 hypothetical protein FE633_36260 [Streptomyces montanus]